ALIVFNIKSQFTLRREKARKRFSVCVKEYQGISEKIRLIAKDSKVLESPAVEPSPLKLQTLCLVALSR
ncbi:hypothetical protein DBR06_SOUSAS17810012, partial [Sousa chinensis]